MGRFVGSESKDCSEIGWRKPQEVNFRVLRCFGTTECSGRRRNTRNRQIGILCRRRFQVEGVKPSKKSTRIEAIDLGRTCQPCTCTGSEGLGRDDWWERDNLSYKRRDVGGWARPPARPYRAVGMWFLVGPAGPTSPTCGCVFPSGLWTSAFCLPHSISDSRVCPHSPAVSKVNSSFRNKIGPAHYLVRLPLSDRLHYNLRMARRAACPPPSTGSSELALTPKLTD